MIEINTASGSAYVFDTKALTWERTKKGGWKSSSPLRTTKGTYTHLEDIEVGKRGTIYGIGLEFGLRWIHTSVITSVREF